MGQGIILYLRAIPEPPTPALLLLGDLAMLKRSWAGQVRNVAVLVAVGVNEQGFREILGVCEGAKEDKESWPMGTLLMIVKFIQDWFERRKKKRERLKSDVFIDSRSRSEGRIEQKFDQQKQNRF